MTVNECPTICEADLKSDLMTSITTTDTTLVTDRTCNNLLFVTDEAGLVDVADAGSGAWLSTTSPRSRTISSLDEIALHYPPSSEVYKMASEFFKNSGTRGVAQFFQLGLWDRGNSESIATALDMISACQPCFTHVAIVHYDSDGTILMDTVQMDAVADWCATNERMYYLMSVDDATEDPSNTANLKARLYTNGLGAGYVHYSRGHCRVVTDPVTGATQFFANGAAVTDADGNAVDDPNNPGNQLLSDGTEPMLERWYPYTEVLVAGWIANVDMTQTGSAYNIGYKPVGGEGWIGVPVDSTLDDSTVTALTGVYTNGTLNTNNNGHANAYVQSAGYRVITRGMAVSGQWLDQIHLSLFLKRQIQDAIATLFVNNRRIAFDNTRGRAALVNEVSSVLSAAQTNGHFTADPQPWERSGAYIRKGVGWVIRQDSFSAQTAARKSQRLAPQMQVCYVPGGGVQHVPITLCTIAAPSLT